MEQIRGRISECARGLRCKKMELSNNCISKNFGVVIIE